jgi:hypothetical protein
MLQQLHTFMCAVCTDLSAVVPCQAIFFVFFSPASLWLHVIWASCCAWQHAVHTYLCPLVIRKQRLLSCLCAMFGFFGHQTL